MAALTQNITVARRGAARAESFGYPVAPGEKIFSGGLFGVNSSGQAVRIQTSGMAAFVGMALNGYDNSASSSASTVLVVGSNDVHPLTVPSATAANINAPVYATNDGTLTLTQPGSGFEGIVGYLVGIENGQTYVKVQGH
jgi:hypothetical protein